MSIQVQGNGGTVWEVDGANFRAARVSLRPLDIGSLGSYALSTVTGTMAAGTAANIDIFQFRWTDATRFAVIENIQIWAANAGTAFAAGSCRFACLFARSWTADGSGGTAITLTTNNQKLRTSFGTTLVGSARVSTTAALTAGTRTLDAQALASQGGGVVATAGAALISPGAEVIGSLSPQLHPIILATNEGIVIQSTVPATGTWTAGIDIRWSEVTAY
jgi:hypothetical protein